MPGTREEALATVARIFAEAASRGAAVLCFPETYVPGYRGLGFEPPPPDQAAQQRALEQVRDLARRYCVSVILPMEWESPDGLLNLAFVIAADGTLQGRQTKNQVAIEEEPVYLAGGTRQLFSVEGVPFGIVICHEGWRYPETVRWAVRRGARIVFHPHFAGNDGEASGFRRWGEQTAPYFEQAMVARAMENAIYFASVNYALRNPETATSVIAPDGSCLAHAPYGREALVVADLELDAATGVYARRYAADRYGEDA